MSASTPSSDEVAKTKRAARPRTGERRRISRRVKRTEWIDMGLHVLATEGLLNVRVEVLADRLGVTKGGFYWHFKDRDALLSEMLTTWRRRHTEGVAQRVREASEDPYKRLELLFDISMSDREDVPGGRLEQAIRAWAATSDFPQAAVKQVDATRLEILTELYMDLGVRQTEASAYAFVSYSYNIGSNSIYSTLGRQALKAQRDLWMQLLVNVRPPSAEGSRGE